MVNGTNVTMQGLGSRECRDPRARQAGTKEEEEAVMSEEHQGDEDEGPDTELVIVLSKDTEGLWSCEGVRAVTCVSRVGSSSERRVASLGSLNVDRGPRRRRGAPTV